MKKILTFVCAILACDALESKEGNITLTDEQFDSIEDAIKADREKIKSLNDQITSLQAENEELKKCPADTTAHVVDDKHGKQQPSAVEDFIGTRQAAQSLYDLVP